MEDENIVSDDQARMLARTALEAQAALHRFYVALVCAGLYEDADRLSKHIADVVAVVRL